MTRKRSTAFLLEKHQMQPFLFFFPSTVQIKKEIDHCYADLPGRWNGRWHQSSEVCSWPCATTISSSVFHNEEVEKAEGLKRFEKVQYETNGWDKIPIYNLNQDREFTMNRRLWPIQFFRCFRMVPVQCATPKIWALSNMASGSHWRYRIRTWEVRVRNQEQKQKELMSSFENPISIKKNTKNCRSQSLDILSYSKLLWAPNAAGRVSWKGTKWIFENSGLATPITCHICFPEMSWDVSGPTHE